MMHVEVWKKHDSKVHPIISLTFGTSDEIVTWTIGHENPNLNYLNTNASSNNTPIKI